MLKFTHSFCRYSRIPCDLNPNIHVKLYTHLCRSQTCITSNVQHAIDPLLGRSQQQQLLVNLRRKSRRHRLYDSAIAMTNKDNPVLITPNNLFYGRTEDLTSNDNDDEWQKIYEETKASTYEASSSSADGASTSTANLWAQPKRKLKTKSSAWNKLRYWEKIFEPCGNGKRFTFKVVSYNVLAQCLLDTHSCLYTDCNTKNLKWPTRAARLYEEILNLDPDILCLQEVQTQHLRSFFCKLEQHGYFGVYKQKTGYRRDGCAIYFKKDRFELVGQMTVQYFQPSMRVLNRDNIGLMLKLVPKGGPNTPIVVVTTHLLYNPNRADVRLAQMQVLLAEIDRFAYNSSANQPGHLPIILTGDFNSSPKTPLIELLDYGTVNAHEFRQWSDWRDIAITDSSQHLAVYLNRLNGLPDPDLADLRMCNFDYDINDAKAMVTRGNTPSMHGQLFNSPFLSHKMLLASVYPQFKSDNTDEATTYQSGWVTVDYIYFSCRSLLKVLERLRLPSADECESFGRIPNDVFPSDHLPLAVVFEIKPHPAAI